MTIDFSFFNSAPTISVCLWRISQCWHCLQVLVCNILACEWNIQWCCHLFPSIIKLTNQFNSQFVILEQLQRLRQACDHVSLTVNKKLEMGEVPRLKDSQEVVRDESSSNDNGVGTVVDDSVSRKSSCWNDSFKSPTRLTCQIPRQFLSDLLNKFKKNANMQDESTSFAQQVAESLSQCVQSNDDHLNSECPICLDLPKFKDAVHSEWSCRHLLRNCWWETICAAPFSHLIL